MDDYPVKEENFTQGIKSAFTRQMASKLERAELEDKFLRLYDENIILKKYGRKRDEEIKRLSSIQLRLENDRKKLMTDQSAPRKQNIDLHNLDIIDQLQNKSIQQEKQISSLKMKLMVMRQQATTAKPLRPPIYGRVNSRIDTGIPKQPVEIESKYMKGMRAFKVPPPSERSQVGQTENIYSARQSNRTGLVENINSAGKQNQYNQQELSLTQKRKLENLLEEQQEKLQENNQEIFVLKEQLRINEFEHEENLRKLNHKLGQDKSTLVQDNVERIRLERELKEKSLKLQQLHDQYINLEEKMRTLKINNDQLVTELENMNAVVKREQNKRLALENQIKVAEPSKTAILELKTRVSDLEQDCEILKEANEKLMQSAFDLEKERQWRKRENALKVQIAQLEATLKADVGEKGGILDRLNDERDQHDKMHDEHREMRLQYFELKHKYDELVEKMSFFTKDSAINNDEIEEALTIVKQKRQTQDPGLSFLQKVDEEQVKDSSKLIVSLQAEHCETINELEKTRNMLILQYKINKEYHAEVELSCRKLEENRKEYDLRLDQYAQLLDIRADRIRKLEAQMRDVAYGTRQIRIQEEDELTNDGSDTEAHPVELERDQNLFEIHIGKINLSNAALKHLKDNQPNIFCTWEFYEFELQATSVQKGPQAEFDFTSQYTVVVDNFFLHYLQKDSCLLELHQSFATDYKTVAVASIKLKAVLDKSSGRLHGSLNLTSVEDESISFGSLEYWVRIRVPMEEALRLFKERSKALGYLESNLQMDSAQQPLVPSGRMPSNVNQLEITIKSCSCLVARNKSIQPSSYCIYKFFDYPDHDTSIVVSSNNPQFNDHKIFPVTTNDQLHTYLKCKMLKIFVIDDTDPDDASYIGQAGIPLICLSHDKPVCGSFQLNRKDDTVSGQIEVLLKWKFPYTNSDRRISVKQESKDSSRSSRSPVTVSLLPGEEEGLQNKNTNSSAFKNALPKPKLAKPKQKLMETQESIASTQGAGLSFLSTGAISEGSPVPGESAYLTDTDLTMTPRDKPKPLARKNKTPSIQSNASLSIRDEADMTFADDLERTSVRGSGDASQSSERSGQPSDDDNNIVVPLDTLRQSIASHSADDNRDIVTITVEYVSLCKKSPLLLNKKIIMIYVAYNFINEPLQDTETPYSLPKPTEPDKPIKFNFTKVFKVDFQTNYERRQHLASMLMPDDPDGGRIRFTLVSEPESDDADCEDVGEAFFCVHDLLKAGRDFNGTVPIIDLNNSKVVLGDLGLSIECFDALNAIQKEFSSSESNEV